MHATSMVGWFKERFEQVGGPRWEMTAHEAPYHEVFAPEETVYLTSDSPNDLEALDPAKVYIIGGLVDHNSQKGLTLANAEARGLAHARFPIKRYYEMPSRTTLAVSHVYEIMLHWVNSRDWAAAFEAVIPKRKGGKVKEAGGGAARAAEAADAERGPAAAAAAEADAAEGGADA